GAAVAPQLMAKKTATKTKAPAPKGRKAAAKPVKAARSAPPAKATKSAKAPAPKTSLRSASARLAPLAPPAPPDANGAQGQYVYCIIQSETPLTFGPLGIGHEPAEVHTVHFRN